MFVVSRIAEKKRNKSASQEGAKPAAAALVGRSLAQPAGASVIPVKRELAHRDG